MDNKGNHLLVHEESSINVPAIAAAHVIKRYIAQASDELSFEVTLRADIPLHCHAFNHVFTDANLIPRRARWLQAFVPAKQHHTWLKPCNKLIWIFRQLIVQTVGGTKTWFLVGTKSCSRTALSEVRWTSSYRFYIIRRGLTVWQLTPH